MIYNNESYIYIYIFKKTNLTYLAIFKDTRVNEGRRYAHGQHGVPTGKDIYLTD